jgi:hypothetical protein
MILRFTYLFLSLILAVNNFAQTYNAPSLTCVQRQSATLNVVEFKRSNVTCGTFIAHEIYRSNALNGPYVLITSITDVNVTTYNDNTISQNATHFYYLKSNYNCGAGFTSLNSDTFDDQRPQAPEVYKVSIENQKAVVYWRYKPSSKIHGYRIDWIGKDTIGKLGQRDATFFIDNNVDVNAETRLYAVNAMDSCSFRGSNSFGISGGNFPHAPILLSMVQDNCEGTINLNWTGYIGWGNQTDRDLVKEYQVLVKINSQPEKIIVKQDFNNKSFIYNGFNYGDTLCIRVKALHPTVDSIFSHSNQFCFISEKIQKPKLLELISTRYTDKNVQEIRWYCDSNAQFKNFGIEVTDIRSGQIVKELNIPNPIVEGSGYFNFVDNTALDVNPYRYQIIFRDACNAELSGIEINSLHLKATQTGLFTNKLTWSQEIIPTQIPTTFLAYQVWVKKDSDPFQLLEILSPNILNYEHNVEKDTNYNGVFCYQIRAFYQFDTTQPIAQKTFQSWSNFGCVTQRTVAHIPNAFKRNGIHPEFKPMLIFFDGSFYIMKIFNRWGIEIFESNSLDVGWNGTMKNGSSAEEGTYIYIISYKANDGKIVTKTGNVLLLK